MISRMMTTPRATQPIWLQSPTSEKSMAPCLLFVGTLSDEN
jgi:hypothetical protein